MPEALLNKLKQAFRDWYGALSIEEVTSNADLIDAIRNVEQMFLFLEI